MRPMREESNPRHAPSLLVTTPKAIALSCWTYSFRWVPNHQEPEKLLEKIHWCWPGSNPGRLISSLTFYPLYRHALVHMLYEYSIYGLVVHTKASRNFCATVDRATIYGVRHNSGRTHLILFSNDWRHYRFLFVYFLFENSVLTENHLLYKYCIYGLRAHTKTSGNVRATVGTVNRWPRSTIRSIEQFARFHVLTIPTYFRGISRLWYNFNLWRNYFFPKSRNARISKLVATCRTTLRHPTTN